MLLHQWMFMEGEKLQKTYWAELRNCGPLYYKIEELMRAGFLKTEILVERSDDNSYVTVYSGTKGNSKVLFESEKCEERTQFERSHRSRTRIKRWEEIRFFRPDKIKICMDCGKTSELFDGLVEILGK